MTRADMVAMDERWIDWFPKLTEHDDWSGRYVAVWTTLDSEVTCKSFDCLAELKKEVEEGSEGNWVLAAIFDARAMKSMKFEEKHTIVLTILGNK